MNWIQALGARLFGIKAAGVSGGPVYVSTSQEGRAVSSNWSGDQATQEGLKASTWVYAGATKISTGLASVPLVLEQLVKDQWQADPAHELQRLLNRPNPHMARQDMQERWSLHMLLAGNAIWWLNLVGSKPVELWPINPDEIKPLPSRAQFISGYEWKPPGQDKKILKPEVVAHWMFVDPASLYWGLSPIMAAARAIDTDIAASNWNKAVLANDGKPPYAVLLDAALSVDQQRAATALLREQLDGSNVRRMLALGAARDIKSIAMNAADMDWLNGRKFSREEIGAVMGVPPILMSFGEAATFSNLDAAKAILWEDRIVPMLDDLCQGLMMALFPYWQLEQGAWRIRPDLSGVRALQANLKTEAEVRKLEADTYKTYVEAGVPPNMAARYLDLELPEIEGGDVPRAPAPATGPPATKRGPRPREQKDKGEDGGVAQRLDRIDQWTEEVRTKVAAILKKHGSTLASAYVDGTLEKSLTLSADDWQSLLEAVHTAVIESEGAVAYTALLAAVTTSGGGAFDVLDPAVSEWISGHAGEMAKGLTETTRQQLAQVISAGTDAGDSTRDIAKAIKGQFTEWTDARATLIARTEVSTAFGASHQLSAEQLASDGEVELVKTWRSAHDSRVRDAHKAMDGETVAIDDVFSNGLPYPSEPNCRCVVTYDAKGG